MASLKCHLIFCTIWEVWPRARLPIHLCIKNISKENQTHEQQQLFYQTYFKHWDEQQKRMDRENMNSILMLAWYWSVTEMNWQIRKQQPIFNGLVKCAAYSADCAAAAETARSATSIGIFISDIWLSYLNIAIEAFNFMIQKFLCCDYTTLTHAHSFKIIQCI